MIPALAWSKWETQEATLTQTDGVSMHEMIDKEAILT